MPRHGCPYARNESHESAAADAGCGSQKRSGTRTSTRPLRGNLARVAVWRAGLTRGGAAEDPAVALAVVTLGRPRARPERRKAGPAFPRHSRPGTRAEMRSRLRGAVVGEVLAAGREDVEPGEQRRGLGEHAGERGGGLCGLV